MNSTATRTETAQPLASPGFAATLASEWTKLRSLRTTWIIAFLAIAFSVGVAGVTAVVLGVAPDEVDTSFNPLLHINLGLILGVLPLKVLGVTAVTSEYSSGMIRATFIATPQRIKVMAAKAVATGGFGLVLTTLMLGGMYVSIQLIRGYFDLETITINDGDAQRFLAVYAVGGIVYVLVPFALGFLLRSTAPALTIAIGMYFLPSMIGAAMPVWIQSNVLRFLPETALDNLSGSIASDSYVYLTPGQAVVTITAWVVGGLVLAGVMLKRRDA